MLSAPITRRRALVAAVAAAAAAFAAPVLQAAQPGAYPHKPVTLILPFPAGGATDGQIRALAVALGKALGQQVVVVNQPGVAGTMAPAQMARNAAPDGYTVSVVPGSLFRLPHLQKVSYDPTTDFTYIANLTGYTYGLVVRADAPWKTVADLLADAKARPGRITYGSTGIGSSGHIAMERVGRATGTSFTFVPFKGMAEETTALLGGHIDVISDPGWGALVDGGKARVLAVLGSERLPRRPQVPTLKELGHDIVLQSPVGIVGPRGMEPAVVKTLQDALFAAAKDSEYQRMLAVSDQADLLMDSAAYHRFAVEQTAREKVFLDQLGIKLQ